MRYIPNIKDNVRHHEIKLFNAGKYKKAANWSSFLFPTLSKVGKFTKQISSAVNLVRQQSIPRVINEYRIAHARQALLNTDESITQILMNAGFQTKSNFNREFQRITGLTPSQFRATRDLSAAS